MALKICDPFQNRKREGKENIQVGGIRDRIIVNRTPETEEIDFQSCH